MNAWWQMWKGALTPEACQLIIDEGLKLPPIEGVIGHGGAAKLDKGFRTSIVRWVPPSWKELRERLDYYVRYANTMAFGFDLWQIREVQFTEYDADELGHYDWHEDLSWKSTMNYHRKLSIVVQLSDPTEYEGGNLELAHEPPNQDELRQRGTVIVFPCFHRHRVSNVTKGKRFSLVAWMDGPKFR